MEYILYSINSTLLKLNFSLKKQELVLFIDLTYTLFSHQLLVKREREREGKKERKKERKRERESE